MSVSAFLAVALLSQVGAGGPDVAVSEGHLPQARARVSLTYGVSLRSSSQEAASAPGVAIAGFSPSALRLEGEYLFGQSPFGIAVDVAGDWFVARQTACGATCVSLPLAGIRTWAGAVGRWSPFEHLAGELTLGYGYGAVPTITSGALAPEAVAVNHHGPVAALAAAYAGDVFEARATVRVMPRALGASVGSAGSVGWTQWGVGLQLGVGGWQLLATRWAAIAAYDFEAGTASGAITSSHQAHRFGLGLRMALQEPAAPVEPEPQPAVVHGHLVLVDARGRRPAVGATVRVGTDELVTDETGGFRAEVRRFGPLEISAPAKDGFPAASRSLLVGPGEDHPVELEAVRPSGPGSIRGRVVTVVKGTRAPVKGARAQLAGGAAVSASDDGVFTIAPAGPGPVSLSLSAPGYQSRDEVVSVAPELEVALELELVPEKTRVPAVIRGFVRTSTGKPALAWVEVVEAKLRQRVGANGAFSLLVPGGRYTVRFEAEGYVAQTHPVQVADGDQSIFHIDLKPQQP